MRILKNDTIGFLKASRIPNLIIIGLTQFVTAFCLLSKPLKILIQPDFLIFIFSTGMIGAAGYIINDYFDQKIDMINRPDQVVVGTKFRRRLALFSHVALTFSAIAMGFLIDPMVGAIHIFSAGALWTYSTVLRRWLLLGTLTISFLACLTLLLVMVYFREFNLLVVAYAMFGCVTIFIRESLKDIISAKGEILFGIQSIPIVWGMRGAKVIIYIAGLIGVGMLSFYLLSINNWTVRYFFFGVLVFVLWTAFKLSKADKLSDFKKVKVHIDIMIVAGLFSMLLV